MATVATISYYLIERGGRLKRIKGMYLNTKLQKDDILLLSRGGQIQKLKWQSHSSIDKIRDDDLFVCWYGSDGSNRSVKGSKVKEMMQPEMVIDYFKFNSGSNASPTPIPLGSSMSHKWKVDNAKSVYVNGVDWHWESHQHSGSANVSYMGVGDKTYTLDATGFDGNTLHRSIYATVYDARKWDECKEETRPVMADMFCPLPDYESKTWNEWPGNATHFCVYDIDGHRMNQHLGSYAGAYIEIYDDKDVRWYKGKIKEIKKRSDDGEIILVCNKEYGKGTIWNSTTKKYDIRIRGVW